MKKYCSLLLFTLFFNCNLHAQFHSIDLSSDFEGGLAKTSIYKIDSVVDNRIVKTQGIGTVMKGPFNKEFPANFKNEFSKEIGDFLYKNYNKSPSQKSILMFVNSLNISEKLFNFKEEAYCELNVSFYFLDSNYVLNKIFDTEASIKDKGFDLTLTHSKRIKTALNTVINNFTQYLKINNFDYKLQNGLTNLNNLNKSTLIESGSNDLDFFKEIPEILNNLVRKDGIYLSFEEFKTNKPSLQYDGYSIDSVGRKYHLYNKKGKLESKVYGFCKEGNIYLNALNYQKISKQRYFIKTFKEGRYFILKDKYKSPSEKAVGSVLGGLIGAGIASSGNDIICLDLKTGIFTSVDSNTINILLSEDTEILNKYLKLNELIKYSNLTYLTYLIDFNLNQLKSK